MPHLGKQYGHRLVGVAVVALGMAVIASGCQAKTDLGKQCIMVKKKPDAGQFDSVDIKEDEVTPGKDFISFGSTDCDDLVCIRDASDPQGTPGSSATGFCSRSCIQTSESSCSTGDSTQDKKTPYTCRALILDEATLAAIKQADPEKYRAYFGDTTSPYFCARPQSSGADAGQ